ncbi:MAG: DUF484 family protein [Xanthomonadales bacterium]|nr:DUF484 family protein [Xanthomonadales bacterium]
MSDKTRSMAEIVAKFLRKDPEFLVRNPEILESVSLPHESGEAVSLIEKQVSHLRKQNRSLSRRLDQLVRIAGENEKLMYRVHELTVELMTIESLGQFFDRLCEALKAEFSADILNLSLFDRSIDCDKDTPVYMIRRDDPELQQWQPQLEKGLSVCGRFDREKLDFLFRSRAQWVQSTVFVPLGSDGLMAIGSPDPARFYPGMGTLFLDLIGKVITHRLALAQPQDQRRSA